MTTYFVTGATGAVGSALIPVLLEDPDTRVCLLLRAPSQSEAAARLETLLRFWDLGPDEPSARFRVTALAGDMTEPHFGLAATEYRNLAESCTHIVHAAGNVRMNLPLTEARRSAVGSARNILALSRACTRLHKVDFVSTVGIGGTLPVVPERWLAEPRAFHNTYEQAKAEAEDLVRSEMQDQCAFTLHRPSMVVGDSRSGRVPHFQVFYHLCEFLSGRRTGGFLPRLGENRLDTVPSDYVARAIAWSSRADGAAGEILHLCSGPTLAVPLDELTDLVRDSFRRVGLRVPPAVEIPRAVFRPLLGLVSRVSGSQGRRALRPMPIFLDYLATPQTFVNERTLAVLAVADLAPPPPVAYLHNVLGYYLAHQHGITASASDRTTRGGA